MERGNDSAATLNNKRACRNTRKFMFMTSKNLEDRGSSFLWNTDTPNKVHVVTFQNIIIFILNTVRTKKNATQQVACSVYILHKINAECALSEKCRSLYSDCYRGWTKQKSKFEFRQGEENPPCAHPFGLLVNGYRPLPSKVDWPGHEADQ
jgi:hypothetical protein